MFHSAPPVIVTGSPGLDGTAWVLIITTTFGALTTMIVTIIAAFRSGQSRTQILSEVQHVKDEVKTMNELTVGQLAERGETRRIEGKPHESWTAQETRHVEQAIDRAEQHGGRPPEPADDPMTHPTDHT